MRGRTDAAEVNSAGVLVGDSAQLINALQAIIQQRMEQNCNHMYEYKQTVVLLSCTRTRTILVHTRILVNCIAYTRKGTQR